MTTALSEKFNNYFHLFSKKLNFFINEIKDNENIYLTYNIILSNNITEVLINSIMISYENKKKRIIEDHKLNKLFKFNNLSNLEINLNGYSNIINKTNKNLSIIEKIDIIHQEAANEMNTIINLCTFEWDKLVFKLHYYAFLGNIIKFNKILILLIEYVKLLYGSKVYKTYKVLMHNILNNYNIYGLLITSSPKYLKYYKTIYFL